MTSVRQKIEIPFQYTAGPAVTRFLEGLKQKTVVAGVCSQCGRTSVPPLSFCGRCWRPIAEFTSLKGSGVLVSYCRSTGGTIYGLIRLDGADSTLVHRVVAEAGELRIGARVELVWSAERAASVLDIAHFRILGDSRGRTEER